VIRGKLIRSFVLALAACTVLPAIPFGLHATRAAAFAAVPSRPSTYLEPGVVSESGPLFTPISRRSLSRFAQLLDFDRDQKATMVVLFNGYRQAVLHAAEEQDKAASIVKEKREKEAKDDNQRELEFEQVLAFLKASDKLAQGFFDDLKATLRPEQAAKFERVERMHRRMGGTRFSIAAGENLDLVQVASDLKMKRAGAFGEAMDQYEESFDGLMKSKQTVLLSMFESAQKLEAEGRDNDPMAMMDLIKKVADHSIKVRDANRAAARSIAGTLNDEQRGAWERAVRDRSYPRVFGRSQTGKNIDKALESKDISEDQRNRLVSLKEGYERDVEPVNVKWASEIDLKVTEFRDKGMAMIMELAMSEGQDGDGKKDGLAEARAARFALDAATFERVNAVLSPGQVEKLPHKTYKDPKHAGGMMQDIVAMDELDMEGVNNEFATEDEATADSLELDIAGEGSDAASGGG